MSKGSSAFCACDLTNDSKSMVTWKGPRTSGSMMAILSSRTGFGWPRDERLCWFCVYLMSTPQAGVVLGRRDASGEGRVGPAAVVDDDRRSEREAGSDSAGAVQPVASSACVKGHPPPANRRGILEGPAGGQLRHGVELIVVAAAGGEDCDAVLLLPERPLEFSSDLDGTRGTSRGDALLARGRRVCRCHGSYRYRGRP